LVHRPSDVGFNSYCQTLFWSRLRIELGQPWKNIVCQDLNARLMFEAGLLCFDRRFDRTTSLMSQN
jgi:hypothetical protein